LGEARAAVMAINWRWPPEDFQHRAFSRYGGAVQVVEVGRAHLQMNPLKYPGRNSCFATATPAILATACSGHAASGLYFGRKSRRSRSRKEAGREQRWVHRDTLSPPVLATLCPSEVFTVLSCGIQPDLASQPLRAKALNVRGRHPARGMAIAVCDGPGVQPGRVLQAGRLPTRFSEGPKNEVGGGQWHDLFKFRERQ
jgi:hypothetical protein